MKQIILEVKEVVKETELIASADTILDVSVRIFNSRNIENNRNNGSNGNAMASEAQIKFVKSLQKQGKIDKSIDADKLPKKEANELISNATK